MASTAGARSAVGWEVVLCVTTSNGVVLKRQASELRLSKRQPCFADCLNSGGGLRVLFLKQWWAEIPALQVVDTAGCTKHELSEHISAGALLCLQKYLFGMLRLSTDAPSQRLCLRGDTLAASFGS